MRGVEMVDGLEIVGKIVWVGLDGDGNLNLVLKQNDRFWREVAVKALKQVEGHVVKLKVRRFQKKRIASHH